MYVTLLLFAAGFAPLAGNAQNEKEMQAWEAYSTPGSEHKILAEETGTWDCEMTFWMGPNGKPETYKSVAEVKMVMGGRYQEATYRGDMMGMPFEGKSTVGYNNMSKLYTTTFIDNMGTGMMVSTGKYNADEKMIESRGKMTNPMDGKDVPFRENYRYVDENTRKIEMFDTKDGKEYKSMEIVMKRRKK